MEKQGKNYPTSGSEGKEDGKTINVVDDGQSSASNQIQTSPNKGESTAEASMINGETNESEKSLSEMTARLDEMGPTITRYQYDEASNEIERLSSEMKDKAMATMMRHLRLNDPAPIPECQKGQIALGNSKPSPAFLTLELKLKELEKRSNIITKRINERKREQAHTVEKVQVLEARAANYEKIDFINDFLTRVPTETDLENLENIRLMVMKRKQAESRIRLLSMRTSALNKAMAAIAKSKGLGITDQEQPVASSSIRVSSQMNEATRSNSFKGIQLPDFTQMPADMRGNFLAKNFSERVSDSESNQHHGLVSNVGKTKQGSSSDHEDEDKRSDDGSRKGSNSGVTIVTMSSEEISGGPEKVDTAFDVVSSVDEQKQASEPESPIDNAQVPEKVPGRELQEAGTSAPKADENPDQSEQINNQ